MGLWTEDIVSMPGKIEPGNSSQLPLSPGGVFTGQPFDVSGFGIVFVSVFSDTESAEDGLSIQQSIDGVNWDHSDDFSIPANTGKNFSINPHAQFMRVVYTNGASLQTVFRLQTIAKANSKPSTHRIKSDIISDDDSELVTAILKIQTNDKDTYVNVDVNNPLPSNGDMVYGKDVLLNLSDEGDFVIPTEPTADKRRILTSFFSDVHIEKKNNTTDNPKQLTVTFRRPISTALFGIDSGPNGTFSNTKITIFQGQFSTILVDESLDNTKLTIKLFDIPPIKFSKILIEFYTADPVTVGMVGIFKSTEVAARIQAINDKGVVTDASATNQGNLKVAIQEYGDTPSIDAFGRLRVSSPYTIFDSKQLHDKQPLFWDELIGGAATSIHNSVNADVVMTVTASVTDFVIRQTKQRFNYQPGKSQFAFITFRAPQVPGAKIRIGLFDGTGPSYLTPKNGVFLEIGSVISFNIAKNGSVAEMVSQANWNFDKLDGTGFSEETLDFNAPQILVIDYEWLGVGRVRVGFVIGGLIHYCHYFYHSNISAFPSVYMSTPNLPLRYSIETDGTNPAILDHICSSVMSEGGLEKTGILRSYDRGNVTLTASAVGTIYALLGLRLKALYLDVTVLPEFFSMMATTNDSFRWSLHFNPTISGPFTYADIADSALQGAIGAAANVITNEGIKIASGYASQTSRTSAEELKTALVLGSLINGTPDELVLAVMPISNNASMLAGITVRELL